MITLSDPELLLLMQDGSSFALVALYDRYARLVYSIAFRILKNHASAEDVSQEIFARLWEFPHQVRATEATLHGWMAITSRNRSIDILRKRVPEPLHTLTLPSPSRLAEEAVDGLTWNRLLSVVRGDQRTLLEMAFCEDMSHAEIAFATGLPLGTIKTKIRRALQAIRKTALAA